MKKLVILGVTLFFTSSLFSITFGNSGQQVTFQKSQSSMPLAFTENQGQWDDRVQFRANIGGATMWFSSDGAYYPMICSMIRLDISE